MRTPVAVLPPSTSKYLFCSFSSLVSVLCCFSWSTPSLKPSNLQISWQPLWILIYSILFPGNSFISPISCSIFIIRTVLFFILRQLKTYWLIYRHYNKYVSSFSCSHPLMFWFLLLAWNYKFHVYPSSISVVFKEFFLLYLVDIVPVFFFYTLTVYNTSDLTAELQCPIFVFTDIALLFYLFLHSLTANSILYFLLKINFFLIIKMYLFTENLNFAFLKTVPYLVLILFSGIILVAMILFFKNKCLIQDFMLFLLALQFRILFCLFLLITWLYLLQKLVILIFFVPISILAFLFWFSSLS